MVGWEREGTNCAFFVHEFSVDEGFSAWIMVLFQLTTTGKSSFIPSVSSSTSFVPFLTLRIARQPWGEAGAARGSPGQGGGHSLAPCPANRVRESGTRGPAVPPLLPPPELWLLALLCVFCSFWGEWFVFFGVVFFFCFLQL